MKLAVVGTGYVGLVTGACFAESGNEVWCIDKDARKIEMLEGGRLPIYEPGLLEIVARNRREGRLHFTTDLAGGIAPAQLVFIAVGTPQSADGSADLSTVWAVADAIADAPTAPRSSSSKAPCPVGTNRQVAERIAARAQASARRGQQPGVSEGRRGRRGLHPARSRRRRRPPQRGRRRFARALRPVSAHGTAVPGHVAGKRRDDQVRRQRHAGDEDQFHQRDGERLRTARRRRQRRAPRHRPRRPHRLPIPLSRRRLRRQLLSQGHSRSDSSGKPGRPVGRHDAGGGSRQRPAKAGAGGQDPRALRRSAEGQDVGACGAWRSSRAPTTCATRRRWR